MTTSTEFFGYKHWTLEDNPRCFYVGKGLRGRASNTAQRNHKWKAVSKRYGLRIEICIGPISNDEVCVWETEHVKIENTYSTCHDHDNPNDIGCNFTFGGEKSAVGYVHTPEQREKASIALRGNTNGRFGRGKKRCPLSVEHKSLISVQFKGKQQDADHVEKRLSKIRGFKHTEESRQNMREAAFKREAKKREKKRRDQRF